tara:strand:- start:4548 stop:5321 length:774 start_codon:yes stop_codon:yes gene_type:complete
MIENFLIILAFNWLIVTLLWFSTLKIKRADFIDIYWGPSFFFSALLIFFLNNNFTLANFIVLILVGIWSTRLALYLFFRNIKKDEDKRYVKIRASIGNIGLYSITYMIQVVLIGLVSLPIQVLIIQTETANLNFISLIGVIIALSGVVIESIADFQMSNFKLIPNNKGKLMDKGLWQFSRHPNYFGDSLFWWGIFILSYGYTSNLLIIISPMIMTYFLMRVSGVTLLERQLRHKKEGYEEYINNTSSFLLMPKKNKK